MSTFDKVKNIIVNTLNIEESKVTEEADILNDLGADSLDLMEVILALEEEFGFQFDQDKVKTIRTVKEIVQYIDNHSA